MAARVSKGPTTVGIGVQLERHNPSQLEQLSVNLSINLLRWKPSCFPPKFTAHGTALPWQHCSTQGRTAAQS